MHMEHNVACMQAFSKTEADGRKEWLTRWLDRKKEKKLQGMDEVGLDILYLCIHFFMKEFICDAVISVWREGESCDL